MEFLERAGAAVLDALGKGLECGGDELTKAQIQERLRRLTEREEKAAPSKIEEASEPELHELAFRYSWREVVDATQHFSQRRRLGSGGCGTVFRGTLEEGIDVAVKVIDLPVGGGFEEEVRLLSRCRHPNLVMLLGFAVEGEDAQESATSGSETKKNLNQKCISTSPSLRLTPGDRITCIGDGQIVQQGAMGSVVQVEPELLISWDAAEAQGPMSTSPELVRKVRRRALVYELLPGGDAYARLRSPKGFNWRHRLLAALDMARGLAHLHKQRPEVFHRDIKTANVLFGADQRAKMADFGLACMSNAAMDRSTMVEAAAGTPGYADPIYAATGRVTEANEVYSMGMVLLELLTGQLPATPTPDGKGWSFLVHELRAFEEDAKDRVLERLDPRADWPVAVATSLANFALLCVHPEAVFRPSFMDIAMMIQDLGATAASMEATPKTEVRDEDGVVEQAPSHVSENEARVCEEGGLVEEAPAHVSENAEAVLPSAEQDSSARAGAPDAPVAQDEQHQAPAAAAAASSEESIPLEKQAPSAVTEEFKKEEKEDDAARQSPDAPAGIVQPPQRPAAADPKKVSRPVSTKGVTNKIVRYVRTITNAPSLSSAPSRGYAPPSNSTPFAPVDRASSFASVNSGSRQFQPMGTGSFHMAAVPPKAAPCSTHSGVSVVSLPPPRPVVPFQQHPGSPHPGSLQPSLHAVVQVPRGSQPGLRPQAVQAYPVARSMHGALPRRSNC
eukprot:TRINITY_DN24419_c0_g1_i2.p1 TRINITY_DN24419_c0_g1~~TRINITY_DN24419_c0_g1_i2.p1  ORF type:complete len:732 (-),score=149.73 TRINITY_DN24419_c0_g1_i2:37-2232(-)